LVRTIALGLAMIAALALGAQTAVAGPVSQKVTPVLTHRQVLQIAVTEAGNSQDPNPKHIAMATGKLSVAMRVMDPGGSGSPGGDEIVDLVVMRGYFHINGSPPPGRVIPPGKVMCLIIDAHTGFVEGRSLGNEVPHLSRLGRVTRLR
jgi:hypothetical protein